MFSLTYFKRTIKSNIKLWAIITGVLCLLIGIVMKVFDPEMINEMVAQQEAMGGFNPLGEMSSLLSLISNQYFGMFAIIFPMVYIFITGNKMIAGKVDKGSMANDLAAPLSRTQITFTSAIYMIVSLIVMFGCIDGVGIAVAEITQPGQLDIDVFLQLSLGCLLLHFAISAISFLGSCLFNSSGKSLALGAGIPLACFALQQLSDMSDSLENLRYLSINTLFDTEAIVNGEAFAGKLVALVAIGLLCYIAGSIIFKKKDLPL
ncbi:ABC transporter permease subunit [Listeria costaricensis]|uniref:ABC transporter permease subunit n=1 Tax=Listeria costaricensis TaxID=2026604 RepID=UPI0013C3E670|nr:ABC transporter permease subunit [Listeria costaricensis]